MIYKWKDGSHHRGDPQLVGEEMERIRVRNNGRLENQDLVDAARPATSPLHSEFEWNDRRAADLWRLDQAGAIIRHITFTIEKPDGSETAIRAFVSVQRDEDRSYTSTLHALSDPELRAQVVRQAWRDLEAWRQRHAELTEFAEIFTAIDQARPAK